MDHAPEPTSLVLQRSLLNPQFESWRIGANFVRRQHNLNLPGPVFLGADDALDYAHTAAAARHNQLFVAGQRCFVAIEGDVKGSLVLHELLLPGGNDTALQLLRLADVPPADAAAACEGGGSTGAVEPALHCSVVAICRPAVASPDVESLAGALLLSSGRGDLRLAAPAAEPGGADQGGQLQCVAPHPAVVAVQEVC